MGSASALCFVKCPIDKNGFETPNKLRKSKGKNGSFKKDLWKYTKKMAYQILLKLLLISLFNTTLQRSTHLVYSGQFRTF